MNKQILAFLTLLLKYGTINLFYTQHFFLNCLSQYESIRKIIRCHLKLNSGTTRSINSLNAASCTTAVSSIVGALADASFLQKVREQHRWSRKFSSMYHLQMSDRISEFLLFSWKIRTVLNWMKSQFSDLCDLIVWVMADWNL